MTRHLCRCGHAELIHCDDHNGTGCRCCPCDEYNPTKTIPDGPPLIIGVDFHLRQQPRP